MKDKKSTYIIPFLLGLHFLFVTCYGVIYHKGDLLPLWALLSLISFYHAYTNYKKNKQ